MYNKIIVEIVNPVTAAQSLQPSPCVCYILKSVHNNRVYIGFTVNFAHRLRQHNGEITGGAKCTVKFRPWTAICVIQGFFEQSAARRFEYRLQHPRTKVQKGEDQVLHILNSLTTLITIGDANKYCCIPWPYLTIQWYDNRYSISHKFVCNNY